MQSLTSSAGASADILLLLHVLTLKTSLAPSARHTTFTVSFDTAAIKFFSSNTARSTSGASRLVKNLPVKISSKVPSASRTMKPFEKAAVKPERSRTKEISFPCSVGKFSSTVELFGPKADIDLSEVFTANQPSPVTTFSRVRVTLSHTCSINPSQSQHMTSPLGNCQQKQSCPVNKDALLLLLLELELGVTVAFFVPVLRS
mmetsp:Transcript_26446/g.50090  ORF Transcript_26446/g.50090 Transcript_26446/m.50090 type:complete len:202 (-) Transcript_26446:234-839(-)